MKIEIELSGFTPILDMMVQQYGLITAGIYGIVWRYAQMENCVCNASLEKIGKRLDVSGKTAERHIKKLCSDGYLTDLTPGIRNKPHSYAVTDKARLNGSITARPDGQSDLGQTESLTRSDRESCHGQTESPLKIDSKIDSKIKKTSANADYSCPVSLLKEKEVKVLELKMTVWKQYLEDERAERGRKGIIKFIEKKISDGPLFPDTPESELLFEKMGIEAEAQGWLLPKKFPSQACKQKFDNAAVHLNGTLEFAITKGLENGYGLEGKYFVVAKLVNYVASPKWQDGGKNEQTRIRGTERKTTGETPGTATGSIPLGSGQTPEMRDQLKAHFGGS